MEVCLWWKFQVAKQCVSGNGGGEERILIFPIFTCQHVYIYFFFFVLCSKFYSGILGCLQHKRSKFVIRDCLIFKDIRYVWHTPIEHTSKFSFYFFFCLFLTYTFFSTNNNNNNNKRCIYGVSDDFIWEWRYVDPALIDKWEKEHE